MTAKADWPGDAAYAHAAWMLGVDIAAMKAVARVEAGTEGAFLPSGEPVVLFERHVFRDLTRKAFDVSHPDLSNPVRGGYGRYSEQHGRLARAAELDRTAALASASWGLFQIMGANHVAAGHLRLQDFINAMYGTVDDHLRAFVMFVWNGPGLREALRIHDWARFAYLYNGPAYRDGRYDTRIAAAWAELTDA